MKPQYVTFGSAHRHEVEGIVLDHNCVARFFAPDAATGRALAFKLFGPKFSFHYFCGDFPMDSMRFYHRGFIDIPQRIIDELPSLPLKKQNENFARDVDPAKDYAPHSELKIHEDYVHMGDVAARDLSRMRQVVDGMAASWSKTECLAALARLASRI